MMNGRNVLLVLGLAALAAACGGGGPDDPAGGSGQGLVTVQVYDAPTGNLEAAVLTFSAVAVHPSGGGWVDVTADPVTLDLLAHVGADNAATIGVGTVPAGSYDAVRFTVTAATLTVDGSEVAVPLPEGGVTLAVGHAFVVQEDGAAEVEMHINPATSFHSVGGGWSFVPDVDQVASR